MANVRKRLLVFAFVGCLALVDVEGVGSPVEEDDGGFFPFPSLIPMEPEDVGRTVVGRMVFLLAILH